MNACRKLLEKKTILKHVLLSDESWFYADGLAQRKNHHYLALSRDAVKSIESQLVPIKFNKEIEEVNNTCF